MSSSNCCFLTCIPISQEAGLVVWCSHLFQNFPQLIVIHTVKVFGIVNKVEIDVFLELSCFFHDPADVGNLISSSSAFSKTSLNIREFTVQPPLIFQKKSKLRLIGCLASLRNQARLLESPCPIPTLSSTRCWEGEHHPSERAPGGGNGHHPGWIPPAQGN